MYKERSYEIRDLAMDLVFDHIQTEICNPVCLPGSPFSHVCVHKLMFSFNPFLVIRPMAGQDRFGAVAKLIDEAWR